jgi:hypothetical protein
MEEVIAEIQILVGCRAGRTSNAARTCLVSLGDPFYPKCVPEGKNTNTTRGTLLVLKTFMKLIMYASCFQDVDGRKLVVRTVNTH